MIGSISANNYLSDNYGHKTIWHQEKVSMLTKDKSQYYHARDRI